MAEALEMQMGLQLVIPQGCSYVEVESDCLEVVHYCSREIQMWNDAIAVYANCLEKAGIDHWGGGVQVLRKRDEQCSSFYS
jgi:hypothetical protein